jgi:hypothetical protein
MVVVEQILDERTSSARILTASTSDSNRCPEPVVSVDGIAQDGFATRFTGPVIMEGQNVKVYDFGHPNPSKLIPIYTRNPQN